MKAILVWAAVLCVCIMLALPVRGQANLEKQIERVFLYQPEFGEKHDVKAKIEAIGNTEEVKGILLKMLGRYKHSERGTAEFTFLVGATHVLGEMREKRAVDPLTQIIFDQRAYRLVRGDAVRSLGQIDAEGNKQTLLKALANSSNYFPIRIHAAEALAKTKDPQVLKTLERYSRVEKDAYVRQRFDNATRELRARIRSGN